MKVIEAEINNLGFDVLAISIEYKSRAKRTYTALVLLDYEEKTARIIKEDGRPSNYKPEYITEAACHIANIWKMDASMLRTLCPFPVIVK